MKIIYTKHAKRKFKDLKKLGVIIRPQLVKKALEKPLDIDEVSDYPKKIASIELDKNHILRVVYRQENDKIVIITFYPAKKGRY